jgi:cysteine desulfurase family protein (TIGR01976 family)
MLDLAAIRAQFPALNRVVNGRTPIYLDGPGGTQVPQRVIDAIVHSLSTCNANTGGVFTTSRESDALVRDAHRAMADLLNAPAFDEIIFGANMTTLAMHFSRALSRTWRRGDAIVVTRLDHDANVRPWTLAAADVGAEVRFVAVRGDGTLDEDDFARKIVDAKLVAFTCASNATGTLPNVPRLCRLAHEAGARVALDAVHYAPHGPIDVQAWDCDVLMCSPYKFFGPHAGVLWAKRDLLESLVPYKVRPAPEVLPGRWMTGTQSHEAIAGVGACVEYLASLGEGTTRRGRLLSAMARIREYESELVTRLLTGLRSLAGMRVWGSQTADGRAPTVALTREGWNARDLATRLAEHEIYAWSGHFYALELAEWSGTLPQGGFLRLGLMHYNTADEVDRVLEVLQ